MKQQKYIYISNYWNKIDSFGIQLLIGTHIFGRIYLTFSSNGRISYGTFFSQKLVIFTVLLCRVHKPFKKNFEDIKGVIKSHKSKDRQYHGQKKKYKGTNNDPQSITQKTNYQATQTPLKSVDEIRCSRGASNSCSTC